MKIEEVKEKVIEPLDLVTGKDSGYLYLYLGEGRYLVLNSEGIWPLGSVQTIPCLRVKRAPVWKKVTFQNDA
jgi:hypothetical protein